jgi:hypothetical protein
LAKLAVFPDHIGSRHKCPHGGGIRRLHPSRPMASNCIANTLLPAMRVDGICILGSLSINSIDASGRNLRTVICTTVSEPVRGTGFRQRSNVARAASTSGFLAKRGWQGRWETRKEWREKTRRIL